MTVGSSYFAKRVVIDYWRLYPAEKPELDTYYCISRAELTLVGYWNGEGWRDVDDLSQSIDVDYWMPLPKPPGCDA